VDDDQAILGLLSSCLRAAGLESMSASSGREAIDKFGRVAFNIVVLDLCLGDDIDGLGVLEAIKKQNRDTAIIMMSGTSSAETREDAIRRGAYAFLDKPFDLASLLLLIRSAGREAEAARRRSPAGPPGP
jgi:DNA-binding NtrC family response regulator